MVGPGGWRSRNPQSGLPLEAFARGVCLTLPMAAATEPLIGWGKTYDSPRQQVAALFAKIAGTYGAPCTVHGGASRFPKANGVRLYPANHTRRPAPPRKRPV